jgi:hypothetical protein
MGVGATNRERAKAEAMRLLALVRAPSGSVRLARLPRVLRPAPVTGGISVGRSAFDKHHAWRVPEPTRTVLAWYSAHHPGGLALTGSGTDTTPPRLTSYEFDARSTSAWTDAQVAITVAPDGAHDSLLRADGADALLDPTPYRDTANGPRIRVTSASGCPASDRRVVGVTPPRPALRRSLLPSGDPKGGVVCTYSGLGQRQHQFVLTQHRRLSGTAAEALAARIDRLALGHVIGAPARSCTLDFGSADVVALSYAGGRTADLWVEPTGCPTVANGDILVDSSLRL